MSPHWRQEGTLNGLPKWVYRRMINGEQRILVAPDPTRAHIADYTARLDAWVDGGCKGEEPSIPSPNSAAHVLSTPHGID